MGRAIIREGRTVHIPGAHIATFSTGIAIGSACLGVSRHFPPDQADAAAECFKSFATADMEAFRLADGLYKDRNAKWVYTAPLPTPADCLSDARTTVCQDFMQAHGAIPPDTPLPRVYVVDHLTPQREAAAKPVELDVEK